MKFNGLERVKKGGRQVGWVNKEHSYRASIGITWIFEGGRGRK